MKKLTHIKNITEKIEMLATDLFRIFTIHVSYKKKKL